MSSTVYCCKSCSRTIKRQEELRAHLYWHGISDPDVDKHFTREEKREEVAVAEPVAVKPKGVMGWRAANDSRRASRGTAVNLSQVRPCAAEQPASVNPPNE